MTSLQKLRRIEITADLRLDTALHIGSGERDASVDSPVMKDLLGQPFIPGSSLKGVVRAHLERLLPNAGLASCRLFDKSEACPGANVKGEPADSLRKKLEHARTDSAEREKIVLGALCPLCLTFGSSFSRSKVFFADAHLQNPGLPVVETRDGVGIDRDSQKAVDGVKYDFEVVSVYSNFLFRLTIENPTPSELGIAALGVLELGRGHIAIGGLTSRGLGRCRLDNIRIRDVALADPAIRREYLVKGEVPPIPHPDTFLENAVTELLSASEAHHA